MEMVLILTLRPLYDRGVNWPLILVGIVAAILLALGLLPPYGELWKRGGRVVGIHFGFLTVDWLGAFFSLLGVAAQETFDPLGGSLFIVWLVLLLSRVCKATHANLNDEQSGHRRWHLHEPWHMVIPNPQSPRRS